MQLCSLRNCSAARPREPRCSLWFKDCKLLAAESSHVFFVSSQLEFFSLEPCHASSSTPLPPVNAALGLGLLCFCLLEH